MILGYLLISPEPLEWQIITGDEPFPQNTEYTLALSIAFTCKQLYSEALLIYYGQNAFGFRDTNSGTYSPPFASFALTVYASVEGLLYHMGAAGR
jgi:hypothetical protein